MLNSSTISWCLSPVTRNPVDGFTLMPALSAQEQWLNFIDWRQDGKIDIEELASAVSALLPIEESTADDFIRKTFTVGDDDTISSDVLTESVIPYLQKECADPLSPRQCAPPTPFKAHATALRMIGPVTAELAQWRQVCRTWLHTAGVILSKELCKYLEDCLKQTPQPRADLMEVGETLKQFMEKGSRRVGTLACCMLEAQDEKVRQMAVSLLSKLDHTEHPYLRAAVDERVKHSNSSVRAAALLGLMEIAVEGDAQAIDTVCRYLTDLDDTVSRAVSRALQKLAKGNLHVMNTLVSLLKHSNSQVRERSTNILAVISEKEDERIIKHLTTGMADADHNVRRAAACGIVRMVPPGNRAVTKVVSQQVKKDEDVRVIYRALKSLLVVAPKGDRDALAAAMSRFCCTDSSVRCQAMDAVATIAVKGDDRIFRKVFPYLYDPDSHMQTHTCSALGELAATKKQRDTASAAMRREFCRAVGSNPTRRRAAEVALEQIEATALEWESQARSSRSSFRVSYLVGLAKEKLWSIAQPSADPAEHEAAEGRRTRYMFPFL